MGESGPVEKIGSGAERTGHLRATLVHHFKLDLAQGGRSKAQVINQFLKDYNSGILFPSLFEELGKVGRSTLYVWLRRMDEGGVLDLMPKYGSRHSEKISEAEKSELLNLVINQSQINIGFTIRLLKFLLAEKKIASPSSAATLRRWLTEFKRKNRQTIWNLLRDDEKALRGLLTSSGQGGHHKNG